MKNTLTNIFIATLFLAIGYFWGQSRLAPISIVQQANQTPAELTNAFEPFWEVWGAINTDYYQQPLNPDDLVEGAIRGLLESLDDRHTAYLSPDEQISAQSQMDQEFQGIGAEVQSNETGEIMIISPFEGSPAEESGLRPRDIILEADGTELTGMDVGEAAAIVRGPAGSEVNLLIKRGDETFNIIITRGIINIPSVRSEILEDGIAYLRLSRFANLTAEETATALEELMAQNPHSLILDLRSNPGGALDAVVNIADQFLPEGTILIESFGNGHEEIFTATDKGLAQDIPLVVLIDEGSASASEVLAGAIRDTERGILMGQTTFGKGTVQSWQPLNNGGGVRFTVARWLTPERNWVHETGLVPDIPVALPPFEPDVEFEDTQLQRAIDYLQSE